MPVTIKTRIGIDADHQTFLDAGRIAEQAGCAAIALHGRTAQQAYSGKADWTAIAALKAAVSIPVLGNGDIWEAADALRMVGRDRGRRRGGRPRLPRPALAVPRPGRRLRRAEAERCRPWVRWPRPYAGTPSCWSACRTSRTAAPTCASTWPGTSRASRSAVSSGAGWRWSSRLADLDDLLAQLDPDVPFPETELGLPRGPAGHLREKVALPDGWLDDTSGRDLDLVGAELGISGG